MPCLAAKDSWGTLARCHTEILPLGDHACIAQSNSVAVCMVSDGKIQGQQPNTSTQRLAAVWEFALPLCQAVQASATHQDVIVVTGWTVLPEQHHKWLQPPPDPGCMSQHLSAP